MAEKLNRGEIVIYTATDGSVSLDARLEDDTIWLTQKAMAELFGVKTPAISKHLKNIFSEGELKEDMVISILETTTKHGAIAGKTQTKDTKFYNLDAIISVGYIKTRRNGNSKANCFECFEQGLISFTTAYVITFTRFLLRYL